MTPFATALAGMTLDMLDGFDRAAAIAAGVKPATVRAWQLVHDTYFGPTRLRKQRDAAAAKAREAGLSVDQLVALERRLGHVADAAERMRLRLQLLREHRTYDALVRAAAALIPAEEPAPPERRIRFSASRMGRRTIMLTADEDDAADLEHTLRERAEGDTPTAAGMADAFWKLLRGAEDGTGGNLAAPVRRTQLLVPLPTWVRLMRGEGDDVILGLTDGTTITGAEFLNQMLADAAFQLEAAVFHPVEGPVNLYRASRYANGKQRSLARAMLTTCAFPGCRHAADNCEVHHIDAWSRGGETNASNLTVLCRYHNQIQDDDPARRLRGRITRIRGVPTYVSPNGYRVLNRLHPYGAAHTLYGAESSATPGPAPP